MKDDDTLAQKLLTILPHLNEKQRQFVLIADARSLGYGGISQTDPNLRSTPAQPKPPSLLMLSALEPIQPEDLRRSYWNLCVKDC